MIGIIGFGRFGRLMAKYMIGEFQVYAHDIEDKSSAINETGAVAASLEEVCRQKIVILAVPISGIQDVLKNISPLLRSDSLVVDVCSVKVYPVQWMKEILPDQVSILATHPMFGPDSAAKTLVGSKIVLCKVRIDDDHYSQIKSYLASKHLTVIETTPEEHDKEIAVSLALTHFIGRSLSEFGASQQLIDTEGYKRLLHILEVVDHDTWQLFLDMNHYNPYARKQRMAFIKAMQSIEEKMNQ
ncbi:MAG: prephenate dehydrogenase/arogenate dehydrogenase family protein [Desulfobacterales bacterium]|jgi:prephenate dehydrogenase